MKKLNNSEFGDTYSQRQISALSQWEKVHADGKFLWLFKRSAVWASICLFLYGVGALLYPSFFNFQMSQFYILFGMFGAFLYSSNSEWIKMEAKYQEETPAK